MMTVVTVAQTIKILEKVYLRRPGNFQLDPMNLSQLSEKIFSKLRDKGTEE